MDAVGPIPVIQIDLRFEFTPQMEVLVLFPVLLDGRGNNASNRNDASGAK